MKRGRGRSAHATPSSPPPGGASPPPSRLVARPRRRPTPAAARRGREEEGGGDVGARFRQSRPRGDGDAGVLLVNLSVEIWTQSLNILKMKIIILINLVLYF
jgi:hypothetical protein